MSWREALKLTEYAASDPATPLAAVLGGLKYPAPHIQIVATDALLALGGVKERDRHKILPFGSKPQAARRRSSRTEYEKATAAMLKAFNIERQGDTTHG